MVAHHFGTLAQPCGKDLLVHLAGVAAGVVVVVVADTEASCHAASAVASAGIVAAAARQG